MFQFLFIFYFLPINTKPHT